MVTNDMHVITGLRDALEGAVAATITRLSELGVVEFPIEHYTSEWGETNQDNIRAARILRETLSRPSVFEQIFRYETNLSELPEVTRLNEFIKRIPEGLPVTSSVSVASYVLVRYFEQAGGLANRASVLDSVSQELSEDLVSPTYEAFATFLLQDFHAHGAIELGPGILLRPIAMEDIHELSRRRLYGAFPDLLVRNTDWICQVRVRGAKGSYNPVNEIHPFWEAMIAAMTLVSVGRGKTWMLSKGLSSPFFGGINSWSGVPRAFGFHGEPPQSVLQITVDELVELTGAIQEVNGNSSCKHLQFIIGRLRDAVSRSLPRDSVVDLVIALESMLAADTSALEVTFRFRNRGASLLGAEFGDARTRLSLLSSIYGARSKIVHGSEPTGGVEVALSNAVAVIRHLVRWYLDERRRSIKPKDLNGMIDRRMVDGVEPHSIVRS